MSDDLRAIVVVHTQMGNDDSLWIALDTLGYQSLSRAEGEHARAWLMHEGADVAVIDLLVYEPQNIDRVLNILHLYLGSTATPVVLASIDTASPHLTHHDYPAQPANAPLRSRAVGE